jgi:pilus assembly protein CpaD
MKPAYPANSPHRGANAFVRTLVLASAAVALGGCYTSRLTTENAPPPPPNDYRLRHPISIQERDRTVVLFVGNRRGGLTPAQRADVLAFAQAWKRESAGGVVIETPAGTPNEHASADSLHEIQSILSAAGLPPGGVQVRSWRPADPGQLAAIRLAYPRMTADAGPCGQWPEDLGPGLKGAYVENRPYYNFGCASQRNLAAMTDNPADLVQPRGETPAYSARRSTALDKYRRGESSATNYPDKDSGKISEVGK